MRHVAKAVRASRPVALQTRTPHESAGASIDSARCRQPFSHPSNFRGASLADNKFVPRWLGGAEGGMM